MMRIFAFFHMNGYSTFSFDKHLRQLFKATFRPVLQNWFEFSFNNGYDVSLLYKPMALTSVQ